MRKIILIVILAIGVQMLHAFETEFPILKGEKWWGVYVGNSTIQPFITPINVKTNSSSLDGTYLAPMLVSSEGRYVWSGSPIHISIGADAITVNCETEKIEVHKAGKTLREAYLVCCHRNFPPKEGGKQLPLELFTKPVYETELEFGYTHTQDDILNYARQIAQEGFPAGTIVLSEGWSKNNGSFDFDREYYPDPRAMVEQLHQLGFKLMLTVTPLVGASGRGYLDNVAQNMLIRDQNGENIVVKNDGGYGACLDLTNPAKVIDVKRRIDELQSNFLVDGFRFDARAVLHVPEKMAMTERFMAGWVSLGGQIELCEFLPGSSRQVEPQVYDIRCAVSGKKTDLGEYLNDVVVAGLSGFQYLHPLVERRDAQRLFADQMLMVRTMQLAMMMPVASVDFAPWRVKDPNFVSTIKQLMSFRSELAPYIEKCVRDAEKTGEPLVRHMEYHFPRSGFADCNDQFMLGDKYLFAPVLDNSPKRTVRLPRGVWVDSAGKRFKGPVVISVDVSSGRMPYFEHGN